MQEPKEMEDFVKRMGQDEAKESIGNEPA